MQCEACQLKPAEMHVKKVVDGTIQLLHVCTECADTNGLDDVAPGTLEAAQLMPHLADELLLADHAEEAGPNHHCGTCGLSTEEFRSTGRFGCEKCYSRFGDALRLGLSRMHRGLSHVGKTPRLAADSNSAGSGRQSRAGQLQEELARAIAAEDYERAAAIRDRIGRLKMTPPGRHSGCAAP